MFRRILLLALETGLPTTPPADHPPQAIVVLSAEVIRAHQEELGFRPGLLTLDRLRTAAALHRRTGLPILVSGGTRRPNTTAFAVVMARSLADDFQTPARWIEAKSTDTWENAHFSADILRADGITSIYVVTHAWHMRRALVAFRGTGLTVTAAPTSLDDPLGPDPGDFLPRTTGWQTSYFAVHEWIGYAWYMLTETFASIAALPPEALTLLDPSASPFAVRAWWEVVLAHAMPVGTEASFVTIRSAGQVLALLPMLRTGNRLSSLTTPYTCEYTPLFAAGLDPATQVAAMTAFGRFCRSSGVVRLDAMPAEWEGLHDLQAGARQAGLRVLRFNHFGNWYEDVGGLDWSTYLLRRPGALRETIRRRLRRAEKLPFQRFDLFTQPAQMDQAAEAFKSVYRRSWKDAEPFPTFNVALMRAMAELGLLRFGVWSIGTEPVAVQVWVVKDGHAVVLKLAHDERPGRTRRERFLRR